jgi:hypothetical protein
MQSEVPALNLSGGIIRTKYFRGFPQSPPGECRFNNFRYSTLEVFIAVLMNMQLLSDVTLGRIANSYRRFGGAYRLHCRVRQFRKCELLASLKYNTRVDQWALL